MSDVALILKLLFREYLYYLPVPEEDNEEKEKNGEKTKKHYYRGRTQITMLFREYPTLKLIRANLYFENSSSIR